MEVWRSKHNASHFAHVYPSGDVYYKDDTFQMTMTRHMKMYGCYELAVCTLRTLGYEREV